MKPTNVNEFITIKVAVDEDAREIYDIMKEVYNKLKNKEIYVCDDLNYVKNQISNNGFAVVAKNKDGKIIGSFIFRFPGNSKDNLGRDIGLEESEMCKVVHMESTVVLPEYRGNGLQLKMLKYAENLIDKHNYKYFMATVSPDNPASYKSFEKNGYKLIIEKIKYNGLKRRIYLKNLS